MVRAAERRSERVVVLRGRESRPHGEGPALHRCTRRMRGTLMSAESARSVSHAQGVDRVRALQRVLYRCAKQDRDRRFHAVYDKVARSDVLWRAWGEVRANRGAAGVDGITIDDVVDGWVGEFLDELAARLRAGTYRPRPLRRVHIPKPGRPGQLRPLGIPCIADRVVRAAAKIVLEPIFEADFLPTSYGFRPGLSAHHALEAVRQTVTWHGKQWALDADIRICLVSSSHCLRVHGGGVEERFVGGNPDSEALSAALADVDGVELAALDTLQHGLARDAEGAHGVDDRDVAGGRVVDEQGAQLVVDADAPGGAGGVVLAADEAVVEPAVQGRGRDAERVGGLGDRK